MRLYPQFDFASYRRRARLWRWGAVQLLRHGRPRMVFSHYGGVGDALMVARVLHEWRKRHTLRPCVWVITEDPGLFALNRDCDHALPFTHETLRMLARIGVPICSLHYGARDEATDRDQQPDGHLIATMCRLAGVSGPIELVPRIVLSADELASGRWAAGAVCIQSTTRNARFPIVTKEWGAERFAEVVKSLRAAGRRVIQVGSRNDPPLPQTEDWRGRTTLRETAAILAASRLFVGLVGGLMHLARAVDCPSVIVYGGRELPEQSGYTANVNIVSQPACSPCWLWSRCDHHLACMTNILPASVVAAINEALSVPRGPLPIDRAVVAPSSTSRP
ncbi:glycosyltransferase family 9 protein [Horticoccus luteus]|uniref:Glycosyltransferase family 9 protein n=1 Tax=Horticoccus luteus TaxID=2862869 RepID=A0A8F9XMW1_9BACT|nr:glycosyltransferase family 9 protein [Horticoccus luteus]QYM80499.1 glycosyltransferase family 9 protein [Horticoccus luteus]